MSQAAFDAVFIDFYGTLAAGDKEAVERACRTVVECLRLPMTAPQFAVLWGERFFAALTVSNHDTFRTLYQCEQDSLCDTVREFVGDIDPAPFVVGIEEYWRNPPLHPEVLEFLEGVRLPICCVSNADTEPLHRAIAQHRLSFQVVVTSEDARSYKPDSVIFHRACERMAVDPKRVIHIGDSLHSDVGGAGKLGITTAWLQRQERIHDIGTSAADHTILSLTDVLPLLSNGVATPFGVSRAADVAGW